MPPSNSGSSSSRASDQNQDQCNRPSSHERSAGLHIPPLSPTSPTVFSCSGVQGQTASQIREPALGRSPAQGNPQRDHTSSGLVLKGCQPGCVLKGTLSSDTLSHVLISDNLLALGIPAAAGRQGRNNNPDDAKENAKLVWKKRSREEGTRKAILLEEKLATLEKKIDDEEDRTRRKQRTAWFRVRKDN